MSQIVTKEQPFTLRDFRQGRITPSSIADYLVPQNSVQNCVNVNFDTIVGSAVVRPGTTTTGTVVAGKTPLGLSTFVLGQPGSTNDMLAVFSGAATATLWYYYNGSWYTSTLTNLENTTANKVRFAQLGGQSFLANGAVMLSSTNMTTWATTNCIVDGSGTTSVHPSLLYRYSGRLLASGDTYVGAGHSNSRVYFSSIVAPSSSPGAITWNTNATSGDWIDINPDDGGYVTGFASTSTFLLVFKNTGMYRLDTVNKSADPNNIFNIGAVSQESIVECQGLVYYFSGIDIRQTDGGFPQQISRAGVQDIINAIQQTAWTSVAAGTDGLNVYFSVGDVTLGGSTDHPQTIKNCVLKFSPRDQSWSVHSYASRYTFFTLYTDTTNGTFMRGADTDGLVQTINLGTTDNTTAIDFQLETQDLEFGNRAHLKGVSDKVAVFMNDGGNSSIILTADGEPKAMNIQLTDRVNYSNPVAFQGHYFTAKWYGTSSGTAPVFEGVQIENVTDHGLTNK